MTLKWINIINLLKGIHKTMESENIYENIFLKYPNTANNNVI